MFLGSRRSGTRPLYGGWYNNRRGPCNGSSTVGNDLNSLATFVAKVKTTLLDSKEARAVGKWATQVVPDLNYRVRPLAMTGAVIIAGLLPIFWGSGTGSEVMSRIAAPMVGGMISAPLLSLFVIPAACRLLWRTHE